MKGIFQRGEKNSAQSILEYTLLIVIVVAVFWGMRIYAIRALGGYWRSMGDTFGFGKQYCEGDQCGWGTNQTYKVCGGLSGTQCVVMYGEGTSECSSDSDCLSSTPPTTTPPPTTTAPPLTNHWVNIYEPGGLNVDGYKGFTGEPACRYYTYDTYNGDSGCPFPGSPTSYPQYMQGCYAYEVNHHCYFYTTYYRTPGECFIFQCQ
jgi:hypothetical protein